MTSELPASANLPLDPSHPLKAPAIQVLSSTVGVNGGPNKNGSRIATTPKAERSVSIEALNEAGRRAAPLIPSAKATATEANHGLSVSEVALALRTAMEGDESGNLRARTDEIPIRVRLREDYRADEDALKNLTLQTSHGLVKLSDVARFRPILMTSAAMVLVMLPAAVSHREGREFRAPSALAVIGAVVSSTLLSLIVVPVFYLAIENLKHWLPRMAAKVRAFLPGGRGRPGMAPNEAASAAE